MIKLEYSHNLSKWQYYLKTYLESSDINPLLLKRIKMSGFVHYRNSNTGEEFKAKVINNS